MSKLHKASVLLAAGIAIGPVQSQIAHAAGLEKNVIWSGHYAGQGGAAVSSVSDSESLFFNPAGLAAVKGFSLSGDITPTFSQFSAPLLQPNVNYTGNRVASFPFGLTIAAGVTDKVTAGLGIYISGGDRAEYNSVDFSPVNPAFAGFNPNVRGDLTIMEYSLGVATELMEGLRVGLSYRIVHVTADLEGAQATPLLGGGLVSVVADSLSGTRWNGFKVGAQYAPKDAHWGLGAAWRTSVGFTASGTATTTAFFPTLGGVQPATTADGTVSGLFPSQILVGGHFDIVDKFRTFLEYDWTEYFQDQALPTTGGMTPFQRTLTTNWQNMSNYRIGFEYSGWTNWALRAGYVLTTQVTPLGNASPVLSSPGSGNTITLGTGTTFMDKTLAADLALEYSWAGGTVTTEGPTPGDYKSNDFAIHLGATYTL